VTCYYCAQDFDPPKPKDQGVDWSGWFNTAHEPPPTCPECKLHHTHLREGDARRRRGG
jgi:hypothetical protein